MRRTGCLLMLGGVLSASAEWRVFQEGTGGWTGTFDRIVAGDGTAVDGAAVTDYLLDGDPVATTTAEDRNLLLRFDDLFGEGPGQVGPGQTLLKADLVLTTLQQSEFPGPPTDSLDFFGVFPMTTGWDLTDADMNGFPDLDFGPTGPTKIAGQIANVVAEFGGVGEDSQARADITELVKAWRGGLPNHGVNLKMTSLGSDGWVVTAPGAPGGGAPFLEIVTTTAATPPEAGVVELREGVDGYAGTFQMRIDLGDGRRMPADFASYTLDGEPPTEDANELLRFDGLVGPAAGQVPPGATVLSARLEYSTADSSVSSGSEGVYALAALTAPVDASTLYSSLSAGPGLEGVRGIAGKRVGGFSRMVAGERVGADVTALVQAWVDGAPNHGFGVFPAESTDGWEISTTGDVIARRPGLRVEYVTRPVTRLVLPAGEVAVMEPGDLTGDGFTAGFAKVDGDPDIRLLFGFDTLVGTGPGQLDPSAEVLRAWLVADTGNLAGDSGIGPVMVEPMAVDWSVASLYSDFGGDGPDAGDGETTGVAGRFFGMGLDSECRLDLTDVVRAWQDGSLSNEGLMLRAETDDSWWMHMPGGDPARAPRLEILVAVASGYAGYVSGLGRPGLPREDDDDGDGMPALVEYGLGLDPGSFDPRPGLVAVPGGLRLEFTKGGEAKTDPVIRYDIEWSDDLSSWKTLGAAVEETGDTIGVTVSPAGRGFYRLAVTEG